MSSTPPDLAERRRSSAAHVRAILDNTLDAVVAMDADGVIRFWNPRAEETFGWERTDAVGRRLVELVVEEADRQRLGEELGRLAQADGSGALRTEVTGRRRDGAAFPLEITVTRIPEDPDYRFSAFARDITERKRSERERERLLAEAEHAREQAEAASRVKDEFLATLSHELRTPLNAILAGSTLLRGGRLDDGGARRAPSRPSTATRGRRRSSSRTSSTCPGSSPASCGSSVRPIELAAGGRGRHRRRVKPAADARGITVADHLDPSAGLVSGDADRLQQVVWNLLSNAIKFTPEGGRVDVRVERADAERRVRGRGHRRGHRAGFLPHVFERFRQADSSNTRTHGGLGLGLADRAAPGRAARRAGDGGQPRRGRRGDVHGHHPAPRPGAGRRR